MSNPEPTKIKIVTGFAIEQPDESWKFWCAVDDRTEPFVFRVSKVEYLAAKQLGLGLRREARDE